MAKRKPKPYPARSRKSLKTKARGNKLVAN